MFEPQNDTTDLLSCVLSLKPYITRTDLTRPLVEEKDMSTVADIHDGYRYLLDYALNGTPRTIWIAAFDALRSKIQNNSLLFYRVEECYIGQKLNALFAAFHQLP